MLKKLEDCLNKSCLIGLSYYDFANNLLKQNLLAGLVTDVDPKSGIVFKLVDDNDSPSESENTSKQDNSVKRSNEAKFILPADLRCWFVAPKGEFYTSRTGIKIVDPDFLITWDIYQTKNEQNDGEHQWWEWRPRSTPPSVGGQRKS